MGLHDREYFRTDEYGGQIGFQLRSAVMTLIIINVVLWIFQVLGLRISWINPTEIFEASSTSIFQKYQVWRLLTANFLHAADQILHIVFNMLLLFICGRRLEQLYGPRRFVIFYLTAGVLAMLVQTAVDYFLTKSGNSVLGASGSVLAVVVLYTCIEPNRQILLLLLFPVKIWVLCAIYVGFQFLAALLGLVGSSPDESVAHWAHVAGAACGAFYFYIGRRQQHRPPPKRIRTRGLLHALASGLADAFGKKKTGAKVMRFPTERLDDPTSESDSEVAQVSARIDDLLDKIHREGQQSLSEDELEFLRQNSQVYRSRR